MNDSPISPSSRPGWSLLFLSLTLVLATVWLQPARSGKQTPENAVAVINGQTITSDQFQVEVRLKEVKNELANRPGETVNRPELFNRIIGDVLLLQAADAAHFTIASDQVETEIRLILNRLDVTETQMTQHLAAHNLAWADFENSVRDYLRLSHFVDDVVLVGVAATERKQHFEVWMNNRYEAADMVFDQSFLNTINPSPFTTNQNS